jgi:pyridoxamine 5'-phosphate oxidase
MGVATNAADWPTAGLDERMLAADPQDQFDRWMGDVIELGLPEPTAMVLATVSAAGQPRARTVLLKGHDKDGFVFFTNRTSRKGTDLDEVPRASLLFPWHAIHRQVIVEGAVTRLSAEASAAYFRTRPYASQLAAWASRQSTVISSRQELEERFELMERRWPPGEQVPPPEFWGGYLVTPQTIEFWHGRANRMHDRLRYRRDAGHWIIERLAP